MGYRFSPPTRVDGARFRNNAEPIVQNLWGHFRSHNKGVSVALLGDTFYELEFVYGDDVAQYDRFYTGGHIYELTAQEATDLTDAGYDVEEY